MLDEQQFGERAKLDAGPVVVAPEGYAACDGAVRWTVHAARAAPGNRVGGRLVDREPHGGHSFALYGPASRRGGRQIPSCGWADAVEDIVMSGKPKALSSWNFTLICTPTRAVCAEVAH